MQNDSEVVLWRVVTAATVAGVLTSARFLVGLKSSQRELESWRSGVNKKLEAGDAEISATHDAVIRLQENVEYLKGDVDEIKTDQKSILKTLAELLSRSG